VTQDLQAVQESRPTPKGGSSGKRRCCIPSSWRWSRFGCARLLPMESQTPPAPRPATVGGASGVGCAGCSRIIGVGCDGQPSGRCSQDCSRHASRKCPARVAKSSRARKDTTGSLQFQSLTKLIPSSNQIHTIGWHNRRQRSREVDTWARTRMREVPYPISRYPDMNQGDIHEKMDPQWKGMF
jgi:hypothetical protein